MKRYFDQYFYGDVRRARAQVLVRVFLLIFAADTCVNMLEHGWRYGADGFNVAHFGWLEAVQPVPSAALYVVLVGSAAFFGVLVAIGGVGRWAVGVVAATFSYAVLMSMLDSYQHHYLLGLALVCFVGIPVSGPSNRDAGADEEAPDDDSGGWTGSVAVADAARRLAVGLGAVICGYYWLMTDLLAARDLHDVLAMFAVGLVGLLAMEITGAKTAGRSRRWGVFWGYPLFCTSVAIVYGFAAYAKTEPAWQSGQVIRQMMAGKDVWFLDVWQWLGGGQESLFEWMGPAVVATQVFLALVYLAAPLVDRKGGGWRLINYLGLAAAIGFHVSVELLGFDIQWFSYYMIAVAVCCLGPYGLVEWLYRDVGRLWRAVTEPVFDRASRGDGPLLVGMPAALATGVALAWIDLPGAGILATGAGLLVAGAVFWAMAYSRPTFGIRVAVAGVLGAWLMLGAVDYGEARFDFYRYAGGDMNRRAPGADDVAERRRMLERAVGYYEKAVKHYEKAEDADEPDPSKSRREKLEEVERKLESLPDPE